MATKIEVANGGGDDDLDEEMQLQYREPLLERPYSPSQSSVAVNSACDTTDEEITAAQPQTASLSSTHDADERKGQGRRLSSLDVFRGLTVALMILVDDAGGAFPSINHSPWFGVTLADFVMPFFLFSVGISIGLVFKKTPNKLQATKKVMARTIKLFLLGVLLQGGYFHGRDHLTYGVDVGKIRWMGVLQRISIGYFLASMAEIWLTRKIVVDSPMSFTRKYYIQWMVALFLCSLYMCLVYGLHVPDWEYEGTNTNISSHASSSASVYCRTRGSLEPPCNAIGYIDRCILGQYHLYQHPVYRRTKECSVNSPDYGPLPPNSPGWCLAPFDPEGLLSSLMATVTCFVGLQFGHVILHNQSHVQMLIIWCMLSLPLLILGHALDIVGIPLCKPLYTLSYVFVTAGAAGLVLTLIYYTVDIKQWRKPLVWLQWMGMNALIVYGLAACDLFPEALQGFYWRSPENNLVDVTERALQNVFRSENWGTLVFVLVEILFWAVVAGYLHMKDNRFIRWLRSSVRYPMLSQLTCY
ncbi:hypothetical protein MLD38_012362 [Melastoma candidum]|uniref:Uncharacterized protein n=1 Tax=Melastoma candidum TaxID=119954 RepID=A0ACB9R5I4_9MYRT|nr:hypothetical protein MLD38_012362 [Melastoma candidum]